MYVHLTIINYHYSHYSSTHASSPALPLSTCTDIQAPESDRQVTSSTVSSPQWGQHGFCRISSASFFPTECNLTNPSASLVAPAHPTLGHLKVAH